jgi:preprotein translocase subunit SecF
LLYLYISAAVIVPGLVSLLTRGLAPSIDFSGGTLVELKVKPQIDQAKLERTGEEAGIKFTLIQKTGPEVYLLRAKEVSDEGIPRLLSILNKESTSAAMLIRQATVGPVLGRELLIKAMIAAVIAILTILLYVAYAFKNISYGLAAVFALFHDILVMVGSFSVLGAFFGVEVDTLFVTAVLTTMSFSVHDTIVVFDRIREYERKNSRLPFDQISDRALTETMGRSLANSITIILMLIALILLSGESIRWFAVALLIGTVSGTYSSPFVATPVLLLIRRLRKH